MRSSLPPHAVYAAMQSTGRSRLPSESTPCRTASASSGPTNRSASSMADRSATSTRDLSTSRYASSAKDSVSVTGSLVRGLERARPVAQEQLLNLELGLGEDLLGGA